MITIEKNDVITYILNKKDKEWGLLKENKRIVYAFFLVFIIVCGILYTVFNRNSTASNSKIEISTSENENKAELTNEDEDKVKEEKMIYVQLCGAVVNTGVYKVSEGTRVFEVIEMAGGLTEDAAVKAVNQAREANDGELIYFPTVTEVESGEYTISGESSLIHINAATKEQLMSLPGIGESKALSIISYRESNNGFKNIEEIMNVSGIKESMYEKIKDLITL